MIVVRITRDASWTSPSRMTASSCSSTTMTMKYAPRRLYLSSCLAIADCNKLICSFLYSFFSNLHNFIAFYNSIHLTVSLIQIKIVKIFKQSPSRVLPAIPTVPFAVLCCFSLLVLI